MNAETMMTEILEKSHATPVVVMFSAAWCGPCRSMKPLMQGLAEEMAFSLTPIDVDTFSSLAKDASIRSVPTLLVYKDGVQVGGTLAGAKTAPQVRDFLTAAGIGSQGVLA